MVSSDAKSVDDYFANLSDERREMLQAVRKVILDNIPEGIEETMNWGLVTYEVPLSVVPETYNGQPLMFAGLASQKRHCSLYMMQIYQDPDKYQRLLDAYEKLGRKPNMGKSCIRFTKLENIPLDTIAELIAECDMQSFIDGCKH